MAGFANFLKFGDPNKRDISVVDLLTPEQVEALRLRTDVAAQRATDTSPVGHWSGALARAIDGYGSYRGGVRAAEQEAAGMTSADEAILSNPVLSALLGGDQVPAQGVQPMPEGVAPPVQGGGVVDALNFPSSLIQSESGGNWSALNSEGYGGRLQFGKDRLADAARAGVIPAGMTGADFSSLAPAVQQQVEQWHFNDIDRQAARMGLDQYIGQTVDGVPITQDGIRAMAHLGGIGGAAKFLRSGGQINPADSNGTSLRDYAAKHGGSSAEVSGGLSAPSGMLSPSGAPNSVVAALVAAQGNPWVAKKYGGAIEALMGQQMSRDDAAYAAQLAQQDPAYRLGLERAQLEIDAMRAPQAPEIVEVNGQLVNKQTGEVLGDYRTSEGGYRQLTAAEAKAMGLPDGAIYQVGPDNKVSQIGGGGVNVNIDTVGSGEFEKAFGKGDADLIATVDNAGMTAMRNMARLDQLDALLQASPQGAWGGIAQTLGEWGVGVEGTEPLQAAQALINAMVPEQRQPGSGPMSDADLALFKQSLPRIINQPGGNALILQTIRSIAEYDAQGSEIVQQMRDGTLDRAQGFQKLKQRVNPLQGFKGSPPSDGGQGQPARRLKYNAATGVLE